MSAVWKERFASKRKRIGNLFCFQSNHSHFTSKTSWLILSNNLRTFSGLPVTIILQNLYKGYWTIRVVYFLLAHTEKVDFDDLIPLIRERTHNSFKLEHYKPLLYIQNVCHVAVTVDRMTHSFVSQLEPEPRSVARVTKRRSLQQLTLWSVMTGYCKTNRLSLNSFSAALDPAWVMGAERAAPELPIIQTTQATLCPINLLSLPLYSAVCGWKYWPHLTCAFCIVSLLSHSLPLAFHSPPLLQRLCSE